jgi:hypothetical protein
MMKTLVCFTLAASALLSPALSFAQASSAPLTRAQVRADLIRVEQAGYNPSAGDDVHYPADIQAAEAKLAAQDASRLATGAVGGVTDTGSSQAGATVLQQGTSASPPQVGETQQAPSDPVVQQAHGLTRKQVYDQLVQAEKDGSLARLMSTIYAGGG